MNPAWHKTLAKISDHVDPDDLNLFITDLRPLGRKEKTLILEATTPDVAGAVLGYVKQLEQALSESTAGDLSLIELRVRKPGQQELFPAPAPAAPPSQQATRETARRSGLSAKYSFGSFVVGASNQFAHAACKAVASQPGDHYNPLFIYGGVGLGKTHLVNAIGHQVIEQSPDARVLYLSSESFMNELIAALRRDRMDDFKNRFRRIDVLIVDDVQFLAGRERTQEEFFHTFNSLYEGRHQIVLTSDKFPKEIPDLEERLRNRFEWGLIADIQPPDMETRVAIVEKKAELEQIELPHEVALFLASHIDSNVRELEGSLTRLGAFASLNRCPITVDFAREVLQNVIRDKRERAVTIESIQKAVCEFFNIRPNELRSKKRTRNVALPRQVAMYLCRRYTEASFPVIGDRFGGRDHSTVIHAAQVVERRLQEDSVFRATVERLERLLERIG
ncbi:MAG TPA: chromosomal replication initiator protein DnaA [Candidatus Binatia bacterium]|nr:chromosomal replication initiator protein DnaA [Candidatus Binatia bacterium]